MRVGVIGAGQLARMMVPPAVELGVELRVFAENAGDSARIAVTATGDYRNAEDLLRFAATVDVVTFDHEHVPQDVLVALAAAGVPMHPSPAALIFAQDKIAMRERLAALSPGVAVPGRGAVSAPHARQRRVAVGAARALGGRRRRIDRRDRGNPAGVFAPSGSAAARSSRKNSWNFAANSRNSLHERPLARSSPGRSWSLCNAMAFVPRLSLRRPIPGGKSPTLRPT